MKDLDFDELDRAVNSIITGSGTPASNDAAPKLNDDTVSQPASPWTQPSSTSEPARPYAAPTANEASVPARPLAARRSSGRFMDVVHPSSDMRTAFVPARPTSREGVSIALPVTTNSTENDERPLTPATPWVPTPTPAVVESAPKSVGGDWPDPLDFSGYSKSDDAEALAQVPVAAPQWDTQTDPDVDDDDKDINQIADAINKTLGQDQDIQAPLESPFLMDAKVDKRPLGAFSVDAEGPAVAAIEVPEETLLLEADTEVDAETRNVTVDQTGDLIPAEAPLPAELQDDLLSIESDSDTSSQVMADAVPIQDAIISATAGPTSITQQYTEKPSTGDQPAGAIFDTQAYRKPLAHPAKKKSGWLMVLWIALLLIVGAGAGAAVYFYVLPLL